MMSYTVKKPASWLRAQRISRLIETIDGTIGRLQGENMLSDEELYEGFSIDEVDKIKSEAKARWGRTEAYAQSQKRIAKMSKAEWARIKAEGAAIDEAVAQALARGDDPGSAAVLAVMARKYEHLRAFYEPSVEMFAGLGRMYVEDERFGARYEAITPGLADYLRRAMDAFTRDSAQIHLQGASETLVDKG
jgi:hypothetical protein